MDIRFLKKNKLTIVSLFILSLVLIGFAVFYFLFFKIRSQATLYLSVILIKSINIANVPAFWVPYWIANSVNIGDKEISPFGQVNAEVIDKVAYEDRLYGDYVQLVLKTKATKNRSGVYLFKNKPLKVGSFMELNLTQANVNAMVISLDKTIPRYKYKKIVFKSIFKEIEPWMADMVKIGSSVINNKGEIIAKLLDKEVRNAEVTVETASGNVVIGQSRLKRDMYTTVEVLVKVINGSYFFEEVQQIKANENIYMSWPEGDLYHHVNEILNIEDVK